MNWTRIGRGTLATVVSAALGLGATACSRDFTVAYLYATASTTTTTGLVDGYLIDYQAGSLTQLANSPTPSGGKNPVTLAASPSGKYIYVVNRDDSNVVQFGVGTDGKLYAQNTYNTIGSFPVAAAVDSTGSFLYVVSTLQPGFTTAAPGPGNITVFPINPADGTLNQATAVRVDVGNNPVGITSGTYPSATPTQHYIYVADRERVTTPSGPQPTGVVLTFAQTSGSAALTQVTPPAPVDPTSTILNGVRAGVQPSGIAVDPTARFVYVTDALSNQLVGYQVASGGAVVPMTNGPFATGQLPSSLTIDPRGKYLYVTNFNAGSVTAYAIDQANGNPVASVGSASTQTDANPNCVTIEPALGIYLYVTNNNPTGTITALQLSPNNGTLQTVQNNPYPASSLPSCAVAVANGQHATQVVNN